MIWYSSSTPRVRGTSYIGITAELCQDPHDTRFSEKCFPSLQEAQPVEVGPPTPFLEREPAQHEPAVHVFQRHEAPTPAVGATIAIVAEHKQHALRNGQFPDGIEGGLEGQLPDEMGRLTEPFFGHAILPALPQPAGLHCFSIDQQAFFPKLEAVSGEA